MITRRTFIQKTSVTAASLPFLSHTLPYIENTTLHAQSGVLKVALMGLGSYANRVAKAMETCTRAKLVGVISGTPSKIEEWKNRYDLPEKNCYSYENYSEIESNNDIDAVYIITPNGLHCEQTLKVAHAGKHVICEKPMAVNAKEARQMVDACEAAGVQLLIGYRMHFEPKTLEAIQFRTSGQLGTPLFFQGLSGFRIGDPNQWRLNKALAGGGAMMDIGIYSVNGARYMLGEEPIWVSAQETKTDPIKFKEGVDETIQFQMGFPSGAIASCLSTYSMNDLDRFYLNGTQGHIEMKPSTGYGPIRGKSHLGPLTAPVVTHQTVQMDAMAGILLHNESPIVPVDGKEGLKDMIIIDALYEAVKTEKKVALPPLTSI
ncbi:MAG: Gfo/Idh/MocA family oxidoreductase [Bacteroidetes bacterium]|nr:Gfo/Idh/MocA family oxidoreductase [Bacteroidota bacterium]